jgi:RNA polymerase sigma-70 factor, ECF subfamily
MTAHDFPRIHAIFRPKVRRYLARLVGEDRAEDLAQTVMLKVSEGLSAFRGDSSVSTWVYRIATNAALDALRRPRAQELPIDAAADESYVPPEARAPSVESIAIRQEMSECVRSFIDRLPEPYATVLVLAELEGFRNAEIAEILGVSIDAVKIRLHRARAALRAALEAGCRFERGETGLACDRRPGALPPA